jgi:hypothetical protein
VAYEYDPALSRAENGRARASSGHLTVLVCLIPFLAITAVAGAVAWRCARGGAGYLAVKVLALPASLLLANLAGVLLLFPGAFAADLLLNQRGAALQYALANWDALSLGALWAPVLFLFGNVLGGHYDVFGYVPGTPAWHVAAYQAALYLAVGHRVVRQCTMAIYDSAVQASARRGGTDPWEDRQELIENDDWYRRDAQYYSQRGKQSWAAVLAVLLSGGSTSYFQEAEYDDGPA